MKYKKTFNGGKPYAADASQVVETVEVADVDDEVFYNINDSYAITINPNDFKQYFKSVNRLLLFKRYIRNLLQPFADIGILIDYHIELSEPKDSSKYSRLHIHGTMKFNTNKQIKHFLLYLYNTLPEDNHVKIVKITDLTRWNIYLVKQQHLELGYEKLKPTVGPPNELEPNIIDMLRKPDHKQDDDGYTSDDKN